MVTEEQVASFRTQGFVHIPGVISQDEAAHFYAAALDYTRRNPPRSNRPVFDQHVNVWTHDEAMKELTLQGLLIGLRGLDAPTRGGACRAEEEGQAWKGR